MAEKTIPLKFYNNLSQKVTDMDDPAELRQTAAWRMAQVPRINIAVLVKLSLIDSEPYVMQEAA